jgi:hypothetical protein
MSNFTAMFQYEKDVFSVIHKGNAPEINDKAQVHWKTLLHKRDRQNNDLNIIEVIETRDHKTDPASFITIVKCENQEETDNRLNN